MKVERTLSIIKPDAVSRNIIGKIITHFEKNNLKILAVQMKKLSIEEASNFYSIHKERQFYKELVLFMTSGPILIQVLEGYNAILKNREIMGNTDPSKALKDTIRATFGRSITSNVVHGSDSVIKSNKEISFFFRESDINLSK